MKNIAVIQPTIALSIALFPTLYCLPIQAQITPDASLPNPSIVTRDGNTFQLTGGTELGNNLFHSFQDFSVPTDTEAVFNNSSAISNIFSRVTGSLPSNIDGLIEAQGTANLFLINPNGILFGPNASLDLGGSFLASTADRFEFSGGIFWSATNPNAPPLLTVNVPIGLQFSANPNPITVRGSALAVQPGQSLALVGGNVLLEGTKLEAPSGQMTLAAIASGTLQLDPKLAILSNNLPSEFRDIQLTANTSVEMIGDAAGGIGIFGRRVTLEGSRIISFTGDRSGRDIIINATEEIETIGTGENVDFDFLIPLLFPLFPKLLKNLQLLNTQLDLSMILSNFKNGILMASKGSGNSGNLLLTTPQLTLDNGVLLASISGSSGRGGDINITSDQIETNSNEMEPFPGQPSLDIGADVRLRLPTILNAIAALTLKEGDAGNLNLVTRQFVVNNVTFVLSTTFGAGRSGSVTVDAESIDLARRGAIGTISTGTGNGGNTYISADRIFAERSSFLLSATIASGNAGNLTIDTRQFTARRGSIAATATIAEPGDPSGRGGDLTLNASEFVNLAAREDAAKDPFDSKADYGGGIQAGTSGDGDGGNILINTQRLIAGGQRSGISTATEGAGRAGDITVNATESVELIGSVSGPIPQTEQEIQDLVNLDRALFAGLTTASFFNPKNTEDANSIGDAGNLTVNTGRLIIRDSAGILTGTSGGLGGNLIVNASESIELSGRSGLFSTTLGSQRAGDLFVTTPQLTLTNGAAISADTFGEGDAGNLIVNAHQLNLQDGAQLSVSATNAGAAGNLQVDVDRLRMDGGTMSANTETGNLGNILVNARDMQLRRGSRISTNTDTSTGGNITLNTDLLTALENSDITANAAAGQGGQVKVTSQGVFGTAFRLSLTPESDITASSDLGPDFSGEVEINKPDSDPTSGALPDPTLQTSELVAQTPCTVIGDRESQFIVTGRGGLPPSPDTPAHSQPTWQDWGAIEAVSSASAPSTPANQSRSHDPEIPLEQALAPESPQLVEAQGWYINSDGKVVLTAEASGTAPHLQPEFAPSCQLPLSGG